MNLFVPDLNNLSMTPRGYQQEAFDSLNLHLRTKESNPCVVIPTGGGKSFVIAYSIAQWKVEYPPLRVCCLAHRKELVKQNSDELHEIWPGGDIGVYSAGLGRKEIDHSIIYASIDSIYNKYGEFPPFDIILIDEAHRIPVKGEGKYRSFIAGCQKWNPNLRVIGFTATDKRMECGNICHPDHILHEVCYRVPIPRLISEGYLCPPRSRRGSVQPELDDVRKTAKGDYSEKALAKSIDKQGLVEEAVLDAVKIIREENRKCIIFFCIDVEHSEKVSRELRKYGINAPAVHAKTSGKKREKIKQQLDSGQLDAVCNVGLYIEGFNVKRIDCVVLYRPTLSEVFYKQMVGRGFRIYPGKEDFLVLDYAHCIDEHGPIDLDEEKETPVVDCYECGTVFSRAVRICPHCGWTIPKQEIERMEAVDRERRMHEQQASSRPILSSEPEILEVSSVNLFRHRKPGSPDSLKVQYRCGITVVNEWVCLDHDGFAGKKAYEWWRSRFGKEEADEVTLDSALSDMFLPQKIANITKAIAVQRSKQNKKHFNIVGYGWRNISE